MCNMLLSKDKNNKELEFIVYNVVFSEVCGKFTTEFVHQQLQHHKVKMDICLLESLFEKWADSGLIFEDARGYVINSVVGNIL